MTSHALEMIPTTHAATLPVFCARNRFQIRKGIELSASQANAIKLMATQAINSGESYLEDIERLAGDLVNKLAALSCVVHETQAADE